METIHDIKKAFEAKRTILFNKCGLFFAFSDEQFEAGKTPLMEGEKYVSIGMGGYLPKSKLDSFKNGMAELKKEENKALKANKETIKANILYELNNYECFYTGDISDALPALTGYDKKLIYKVFNDNKNK